MSIYIDWTEEGMTLEGKHCLECGSTNTYFESMFSYWKCEDCSTVWEDSGSIIASGSIYIGEGESADMGGLRVGRVGALHSLPMLPVDSREPAE